MYTARTKCRLSHLEADISVHPLSNIRPSFVAALYRVSTTSFDMKGGQKGNVGEYKKQIVLLSTQKV
jgi:hypothetical protein